MSLTKNDPCIKSLDLLQNEPKASEDSISQRGAFRLFPEKIFPLNCDCTAEGKKGTLVKLEITKVPDFARILERQ